MRRRGVTRQYSSLLAVPLLLPILQNRGRETNHGLAECSWKTISTTTPKLKSTFGAGETAFYCFPRWIGHLSRHGKMRGFRKRPSCGGLMRLSNGTIRGLLAVA